MSISLQARHQPSGVNSFFIADGLTFSEYQQHTLAMLQRVHARLNTADPEKAAMGNAPFAAWPADDAAKGTTKAYRRGVLLVHGLSDSPYFMRQLASFFQAQGFCVLAILLPGNGTQPGDLLHIRWQEWAKTVAFGADRLAEYAEEIYLAGFSAGGALAVLHSLQDKRVRGLFLYAPALKISPRAAWAKLHKFYSWLVPAAKWLEIKPDDDLYKYESFPKNAAAQMHALIKKLNQQLATNPVSIPVYAAASAIDSTVHSAATVEFMTRTTHHASKLLLYVTDPDNFQPSVRNKLELVGSVFPEQNILGSAHSAIVLSDADAHYGIAGDYACCAHYYPQDMEKYQASKAHPELALQGEITAQNLATGLLRRLMYNPNFAALEISMQQFIKLL